MTAGEAVQGGAVRTLLTVMVAGLEQSVGLQRPTEGRDLQRLENDWM